MVLLRERLALAHAWWRTGPGHPPFMQAANLLQMYCATLPAVRELALRTQPAWVAQAAQAAVGMSSPSATLLAHSAMQQQGQVPGTSGNSLHLANGASSGASRPDSRRGSAGSTESGSAAGEVLLRAGLQQEEPVTSAAIGSPQALPPAGPGAGSSTDSALACGSGNSVPTVCASQGGDPGSAGPQQERGRATAGSQAVTPSSQPGSAGNGALLQRQLEAAAFAAWARAGGCPEDWHAVFYMAVSTVAGYIWETEVQLHLLAANVRIWLESRAVDDAASQQFLLHVQVSAVPELLASALLVATLPEAPLLT